MKRLTAWAHSLIAHKCLLRIMVATAIGWHQVRVSRPVASLSLYALLSLIPLLATCHAFFTLVLDEGTLTAGLDAQFSSLIGGTGRGIA